MVIERLGPVGETPLALVERPEPSPGPGQVLIRVSACGVCHTELDEIEGRTPPPRLPVIPGHQVVGRVAALGPGVRGLAVGDRVGVAWIFRADGQCPHCRRGDENLCAKPRFLGVYCDGGYSDHITVPHPKYLIELDGLDPVSALRLER